MALTSECYGSFFFQDTVLGDIPYQVVGMVLTLEC